MFKSIESLNMVRHFIYQRSEFQKLLLLSILFSVSMAAFRIVYTGEGFGLFLIWNLFLGCIPYTLSSALFNRIQWMEQQWRFAAISLNWLLFIPNSFYIITDLFHLKDRFVVPLWYDLMLILSFAWNGMLVGILSIRQMEKIFYARWRIQTEVYFIYPVMFLNALGVFIGRYMRFNSWDVLTNPFQLIRDIVYLFLHPIQNRFDWSMIFCFTCFMTLVYLTIKKLTRSIA